MANDLAAQTTWQFNGPSIAGGNKRIRRMKDWEVSFQGNKEAANEVGGSEPVGWIITPGPRTITFTIRERKGATPEIDWAYLEKNDVTFSLTRQIVGGRRIQYPECQVSVVSESGDSEGMNEFTVEISALSVRGM